MGAYKAAVVTESGQNLIAQALADQKTLIFTGAKTSSYAYPSGTNITALTGLQDVVQSVQPFKSQVLNNNVAQVSVRFDNDGITQQYQIQTIGLYAKIEDGEEILFSVTQAITPDEMPVQSSVSPSAFIYNIQSTVQNASQITVTVNPAGTATVQDVMDIENPVFDDSGAVAGITSFPSFLSTLVSKMNIFQFYKNLKAGLQFVLHTGQIVNNCMSESPDLPLAAAQGKVLMDLITQLNSKIEMFTLMPHSRTTFDTHENGIYMCFTNFAIPGARSLVVVFGGNENQINDTQPATLHKLVAPTDSYIVYAIYTNLGNLNRLLVSNLSTHTIGLTIMKISKELTYVNSVAI